MVCELAEPGPLIVAQQNRHAWMSHMVDKAPNVDPIQQRVREWEPKEHRPCLTWSRSGYKPYNTYVELHSLLWIEAARADVLEWQSEEQVLTLDACCEAPPVSAGASLPTLLYISRFHAIQPP